MTNHLPKPNSRYGYTWTQVQEIMGNRLSEFMEWAKSNTMCADPVTGEPVIYVSDVENFVLRGGNDLWD